MATVDANIIFFSSKMSGHDVYNYIKKKTNQLILYLPTCEYIETQTSLQNESYGCITYRIFTQTFLSGKSQKTVGQDYLSISMTCQSLVFVFQEVVPLNCSYRNALPRPNNKMSLIVWHPDSTDSLWYGFRLMCFIII